MVFDLFWIFLFIFGLTPVLAATVVMKHRSLESTPVGKAVDSATHKAPFAGAVPFVFWGSLTHEVGRSVAYKALPPVRKRAELMAHRKCLASTAELTTWLQHYSTEDLRLFGVERGIHDHFTAIRAGSTDPVDSDVLRQDEAAAGKADPILAAAKDRLPTVRYTSDCRWCTWSPYQPWKGADAVRRTKHCPDHGGEIRATVTHRDCPDCAFEPTGSGYLRKPCHRHGGPPPPLRTQVAEVVGEAMKSGPKGPSGATSGGYWPRTRPLAEEKSRTSRPPTPPTTTSTTSESNLKRIARVETAVRQAGDGLKLAQADPACADCVEVMFHATSGSTRRYAFPCDFHRAMFAQALGEAFTEHLSVLSLAQRQCQTYERLVQMWWCDFPAGRAASRSVKDCLNSEVRNVLSQVGAIITAGWKAAVYVELLGESAGDSRTTLLGQVEETMARVMRVTKLCERGIPMIAADSAATLTLRERGIPMIAADSAATLTLVCADLTRLHHFVLDGGPDGLPHG